MITFIIPTIGRESLLKSIESLIRQTIREWLAIIIFDGVKNNIGDISDSRITILEIEKMGVAINNAGNVRNYGMSFVETEWIAFLDDDDIIADDYIEKFYEEYESYSNIDVLIFRMNLDGRIIPKLKTDNFYVCDVGISFIIKKDIFDNGIKFIPDGAEDFMYLDNIRKAGYKMMISPYIKYFVKNFDDIIDNIGNRVFINMNNSFITLIGYSMIMNSKSTQ
jgi:glycosyltransferase involved in cell wall biosynthesis